VHQRYLTLRCSSVRRSIAQTSSSVRHDSAKAVTAVQSVDCLGCTAHTLELVRDEVVDVQLTGHVLAHEFGNGVPSLPAAESSA
jgi:hypothetical protein